MDENNIQLRSIESFLRRASQVDMPFMAKGSIISRQFFPKADMRKVQDSDWVYLNPIDTEEEAEKIFSNWAIAVTEMETNDGIKFRSFSENKFWRRVDYAMNDDFPTVNTDLLCYVDGLENDRFELDISFNLDIDYEPETILYQPINGDPFYLKNVCPYPLQVSWKLHQLLVRPRLKDIFDLIHLLSHERFTSDVFYKVIYALKKECKRDDLDVQDLLWYVDGRIRDYHELEEKGEMSSVIGRKLHNSISGFKGFGYLGINEYRLFTEKEYFPFTKLSEVFEVFRKLLIGKGFTVRYLNCI